MLQADLSFLDERGCRHDALSASRRDRVARRAGVAGASFGRARSSRWCCSASTAAWRCRVDFPRAAIGIQSDEATYYMMGHSLAEDGDLTYRREDLVRVWREFPSGPTGVFLKQRPRHHRLRA